MFTAAELPGVTAPIATVAHLSADESHTANDTTQITGKDGSEGKSTLSNIVRNSKNGQWGRETSASIGSRAGAIAAILGCPVWVAINFIALESSDGSLFGALEIVISAISERDVNTLISLLPKPSWNATLIYAGWLLSQAILFLTLPGRISYGQQTPGGHRLRYKTNGLTAWILTHLLFGISVYQGWLKASVIARNWPGLIVVANVYGYLLAVLVKVKAQYMPSYPEDCKRSGSWAYDFWMGVELNPRLGESFDLKLFHNGRPGIVAWTLIDISFAAYQYEVHGYISNSILIVLCFHALYVLDFFANEDWYLRTIDVAHDHFGMMLAWGDAVFLPTFYTLQAQYSAHYPADLSSLQVMALLTLGLTGYIGFRAANEQKDYVRRMDGDAIVWNRPATFIRCEYRTADGIEHSTVLITSGWWGVCRHSNYTADLLLTFAMCAACGTLSKLLPWSYFLYMCVLLTHRTWRDEARGAAKYGEKWDEYCRVVPWRLIPGIY